jgi:quinone-modifying oxidoreductase subunit QmoC
LVEPDLEFIRSIQANGGEEVNKCYQCATCSVTCELSPAERPFPRKEMLWAQWGLKDKLISDPDVWLCHQCNDCTTRCPRGARPGDVLAAVRASVYESFTSPSFMGKALANPMALPILFLVPMIIVAALVVMNMSINGYDFAYFLNADSAMLTKFVPSGYTEALFIAGNILIFIIAFSGLKRFWNQLNHDAVGEAQTGFWPAALQTIKEIATHEHFDGCGQNKPRKLAHILVLYGFFGAAATAGMALVFGVIFHHMLHLPFGIATPIDPWTYDNNLHKFIGIFTKVLGATSGLMIFGGALLMITRREDKSDDVGADGYPDRLFLHLVFWVGLTGLLSWLLRLLGQAIGGGELILGIAYMMYYIHIVIVFVILWYMPYSKFAHMLYRTMAMIWARQHGRMLSSAGEPVVVEAEKEAA